MSVVRFHHKSKNGSWFTNLEEGEVGTVPAEEQDGAVGAEPAEGVVYADHVVPWLIWPLLVRQAVDCWDSC